MGADLYITPLYEPQRKEWEPKFQEAAQKRDRLKMGSPERDLAQLTVEKLYDKMYECGYFRDPYNDWDLLWKFGLSWWQDVIPMLNEDRRLSVAEAGNLLDMLKTRENTFEMNLAELSAKDQDYFRACYAALQKFLNEAIDLNSPIDASL